MMDQTLNFRDIVAAQTRDAALKTKGERTRARIRIATIDALNVLGWRDMKLSDICERADVTPPVLYLYFANKTALTEDVLHDFLENFMASAALGGSRERSAFAAIEAANLRWIGVARANAGLMRCLFQFSEEQPEFAAAFADANHRWYTRVAQSVVARFPEPKPSATAMTLAAYAFGGMMDELVRRLFAIDDRRFAAIVDEVAPDDASLARFVSHLWYRGLYGAEPEDGHPLLPPLPA